MVGFDPERGRAAAKKPRITRKAQLFREVFMMQQWMDPIEAARKVGYEHPEKEAPKLLQKLAQHIESDKDEFRRSEHMDGAEAQQWLARIGRGAKSNPMQIRAIELACRIAGLLNEEMVLRLEKKDIEKELDSRTTRLLDAPKKQLQQAS